MTKADLERVLRERLTEFRTMPGILNQPLSPMQVAELTANLLSWFWKALESTEAETREACGKLP